MPSTIAILGNPNVGKTSIFNALTGLNQSTANYAGVTIDRKFGRVNCDGATGTLVDLPGAYSLAARSPDELIVADVLLGQRADEDRIDGMLIIVDASNLERNLYFVSQLLEMEIPAVVALNMIDVAKRRGIKVDADKLSEALGLPVVPVCGNTAKGIDTLKLRFAKLLRGEVPAAEVKFRYPGPETRAIGELEAELAQHRDKIGRDVPRIEAVRLLVDEGGETELRVTKLLDGGFPTRLKAIREHAINDGVPAAVQEANARYGWAHSVIDACVTRPPKRIRTRSEKIDDVVTHRIWGTLIFAAVMLFIFQSIYAWAVPAMDLIDGVVGMSAEWAAAYLPEGMLQSLVVDGLIAGVGSVVIFLPQILLLSLFIAILEDCGYMARAAFLLDRLLSWCGLSGQSFIPMLTSFACAIPGLLATRTIQNRRDRLVTMLVAPLMSCSARLPVYIIMIAAFVPARPILGGLLGTQAVTLFCMYLLGVVVAAPVAWILKKTLLRGPQPPFLLEMPSYKTPRAATVFIKVYREGREFLVRAGTLIFAVTIVVWALAYFPHPESVLEKYEGLRTAAANEIADTAALDERIAEIDNLEAGELLRGSVLGRIGHVVEPVFRPLGWDWRIATAAIASFPAREIIVATLGTLFNLGADEDEESPGLRETLRNATWPDGTPLFTLPVALSIMVFFALCAQCGATLMVMKRETKQWRWPIIAFTYMTTLAYIGAFLAYQIGTAVLS
ncbi:MAG: ferrous iron transport protein B [Candidatus Hydrogenedens sp.]|nr:ferrous iron transport protein B [Candidatus Hydrogenedens sp.]